MQTTLVDRLVSPFRILCIAALLAGAACYVVFTLDWQWMWDTQVMHYIVLLLRHGRVPYRDIYDLNMPGSYLTERWALAVFGGSDLGWRLYEFTLLGTMTAAMIAIARRWDWLAGLFAGVLFTVQLGSYGPWQAAERDEVMTVLIFVGYAFLFAGLRRRLPWLLMPFGLAMGIAALIKPTVAPFVLCLMLLAFLALRKRQIAATRYMVWGFAGMGIALAILLGFLLPGHALAAFAFTLRKVVPYYSSLAHPSLWVMVRRSLPAAFLIYLPLALLLASTAGGRGDWEMWALRLGILFGAFSYFLQHKGYDYHRIPFVCFGLLWAGIEFCVAMKDRGWRRWAGAAGLAFGALLMVPFQARKIRAHHDVNTAAYVLEDDLSRLGGSKLDGKVECFDMVSGCYSALFRAGLAGSTGFTGDTILFTPDDGNLERYYRKLMWDDLHRNPPAVIIVSNEWYQISGYSFDKLKAWPEFRDYLNSHYRLLATQGPFPLYDAPTYYRIYVLPEDYPHPPALEGAR